MIDTEFEKLSLPRRQRTGRPKGIKSKLVSSKCECGQFVSQVAKAAHLRSKIHTEATRIRALLDKKCISHSEIAKRVGLTRERVRQIAHKWGYETGRVRGQICALEQSKKSTDSFDLMAILQEECKKHQLLFDYKPRQWKTAPQRANRLEKRECLINGKQCRLRTSNITTLNGNEYITLQAIRNNKPQDFILYYNREVKIWLVLPFEKRPLKMTMFAKEESNYGIAGVRNWRQYINAWHLLKEAV
jgi:hypothetical protein